MRYTIFGATGGTGRELVQQALDAGHTVTAVLRDPARLPVRDDRLTLHTLDVRDAAALAPALAECDAALSALGAPSNKAAGIASRGTAAILEALAEAGVRRYVAVSAVPVAPADPEESAVYRHLVHPLVHRAFRDVYADLAVMEDVLRASSAAWTIVRPPKLNNRPASGSYRTRIGGPVLRSHTLSRADLAHAMLDLVDAEETVHEVVGVAG